MCEAIEAGAGQPYALLVAELAKEHDPLAIAAAATQLASEASGGGRDEPAGTESPSDGRPIEDGVARLYLDAGRRQGIRPQDIVGSFTAEAEIPGSVIGTIDLFNDFAFVEVEPMAGRMVLDRASTLLLRGREVHVTPARPRRG